MDREDGTNDSGFDAELSAYLSSVAGEEGADAADPDANGSMTVDPGEDTPALSGAVGPAGRMPEGSLRVLQVLKRSSFEVTELVAIRGRAGGELGPFVRKEIDASIGLGTAYELLFRAQRRGLRCPNLPRVAACTTDAEKTCVLMERLPGRTLEDYVRAAGASVELAQDAIAQVAAAVGCLHAGLGTGAPLIHRDLKPSNVMVVGGQDGIARTFVVIDLGIARAWRPGADSDTLKLGTRSYAPPEQFGFGQTGVRSDVYALGALLYFCLTGEDPEPGRAAEALARRPGVPPELAQVVARAMSFDPKDRYASAAELAAAVGTRGTGANGAPDGDTWPAVAPSAARPSVHSLVPRWLGRVWNAALLVDWVLVACAGVWSVFYPTPLTAAYPLWFRFLEFVVWMPVCAGCVAWLFVDKRRLREKHPGLVRWTVWRRAAVCAGVICGSTLLLAFIGAAEGAF